MRKPTAERFLLEAAPGGGIWEAVRDQRQER